MSQIATSVSAVRLDGSRAIAFRQWALDWVPISLAFIVMAVWSWLTWPDILVDFGRELYIPWQLSTGKALYTDIAYYSGPLSPYVNALWFTLFGVGLRTLVWANLGVLAIFIILLHRVLADLSDRFTATVGCLVFIFLFAFAQYVGIGNYNYICPYSHDAVHGLMLSMLAFHLATRYLAQDSIVWLVGSGIALGLAFLTRAEVFLPGVLSVAAMLGLDAWSRREKRARSMVLAMIVPLCALIPIAVAFLLLARRMPLHIALTGTLGTWPATISGKAAEMHYFQFQMGTDNLRASLTVIGQCLAAYAGIVFVFLLISWLTRRLQAGRNVLITVCFVVPLILFSALFFELVPWQILRGLPVVILVSCLIPAVMIFKGNSRDSAVMNIKRVGISLFALTALGKILLNVHVFHYGFVLAMPAVMVAVLALLNWIPTAIQDRWFAGAQFRALVLGLIAATAMAHVLIENRAYASKSDAYVIQRGVDSFRSDKRADPVRAALKVIDDLVGPRETLLALPEGAMLNYLTRRVNPTPHTNWMPTDLIIFGEENAFKTLRDHPPDWIVLVHKDTSEFGVRFFGTDYGRDIMDWVRVHYSEVGTIRHRPLESKEFGMLFLKKR